jgi:hypothetical protein
MTPPIIVASLGNTRPSARPGSHPRRALSPALNPLARTATMGEDQ